VPLSGAVHPLADAVSAPAGFVDTVTEALEDDAGEADWP
jgi:hypothetical protein